MALSTTSKLPPHFKTCVLGGGISGCSALKSMLEITPTSVALVEMGRGLGGRCSTRLSREDSRVQIDHGAPKADVQTGEGLKIMKSLEDKGFARQIKDSKQQFWRGDPNMSSLCEGLTDGLSPKPNYFFNTMVRKIHPSVSNGKVKNWTLKDKNDDVILTTDWIVISGSGVAHPRWTVAFGGNPPLIEAAELIGNSELDSAITTIGDIGAKPVQVAMMAFDILDEGVWKSIATDNLIIETPDDEVIDKLVLRKSIDKSLISVVAHSTTEFARTAVDVYGSKSTAARIGGANSNANREKEVLGKLMDSVNFQLKKITGQSECLAPTWGPFLHRWGNAFPSGSSLSLDQAVIDDAKIAFCGDYVGERFGTVEGALLSGMYARRHVGK